MSEARSVYEGAEAARVYDKKCEFNCARDLMGVRSAALSGGDGMSSCVVSTAGHCETFTSGSLPGYSGPSMGVGLKNTAELALCVSVGETY